MSFNETEQQIHEEAMTFARDYKALEVKLIAVLREVERIKLYRKLELTSLFSYATAQLHLSEPTAYSFITVARKTMDLPRLNVALAKQEISVYKASRIASVLHAENADELIEFAKAHSIREIDREVARRNPRALAPDRTKQSTMILCR